MFSRRLRGVLSISLAFAATMLPVIAPATLAARGLSLTTQFPSVTVTPGSDVSLDLDVDAAEAARVELTLSGVPASWTAELRGGGFVVGAVQVNGSDPTTVRLDVNVPEGATGTTRIVVRASATGTTVELPIDIRVLEGAGGTIDLDVDSPSLTGPSDQTFTFAVAIRNDKEQDITFTSDASGPTPDWEVEAKGAAQGNATTGNVKAGSSGTINVTVDAPDNVAAGTYPINLTVTAGGETLEQPLEVVITGSYSMTITTPNSVLSGRGSANNVTDQQWVITNTGTAPITNVTLTTTPPTDWKVTFEPESVDSIPAGETATITAHITPSGDAIAGDYSLTFRAGSEEADDVTAAYRITIEASLVGAIIGAALIIAVFAGLYWVFRRYGRR